MIVIFALVGACSDDDDPPQPDVGIGDAMKEAGPDLGEDSVPPEEKFKITAIVPDNGFACPKLPSDVNPEDCNGKIPVTLVGENFKPGLAVYVDGGAAYILTEVSVTSETSLSFSLPKQPYDTTKPFKSFISVGLGKDNLSNEVAFRYTISQDPTDDFKGSVVTESTEAFRDYASLPIEGKVYIKDLTDTTTGVASKIKAEVGLGPVGEDPTRSFNFRWSEAKFKADDGTYDLYEAKPVPVLSGDYDIAFRFSQDNGNTWVYVDRNEADLKYAPADAGKLKVTDPPSWYCQSDENCKLNMFRVACKVESDWKANRCVECLEDNDCTGNQHALGPKCDPSAQPLPLCYCAGDGDCATNPNGRKCLDQGKYCGCTGAPNECETPKVCLQDYPEKGLFGCGDPPP